LESAGATREYTMCGDFWGCPVWERRVTWGNKSLYPNVCGVRNVKQTTQGARTKGSRFIQKDEKNRPPIWVGNHD